ncbi:cytochrome c [Cupriavidus respiraculi]|uniref:Gluconate 2-dehydrogenase cytochrome c subunit n=2 Tax=Cupriavidus respiraculi TaxID=195930 RepID=A0ABM8WVE5_9BURK|nr:cytochrome c [Cupriavidus respiraculi]CAG9171490.1 Gluconate 2-dehydrogenase cytochrome c subunit [Cupriavidus respiraculi]
MARAIAARLRRARALLAMLPALAASPAVFAQASTAAPAIATAATPAAHASAQIERGRYLARAANCMACHTSANGAPFAGGLPLDTPVGRVYSTNITPDPETGIGAYTFADFDRAVRRGIARHGERLYPAMPYPSYARMDDRDVEALFAFLQAEVKPVRQDNPDADMRWPFSMRWLLRVWNWLFLDSAPIQADAAKGEAWNRGAYLVQAVGHCGACHTPRGVLFAEKALDERSRDFLSGAQVSGWSASNLTGDQLTGLGSWSAPEIAEYLRTGRNVHATSFGPMSEVISSSTQYLSDPDLQAIAVYLKSLPGRRGETQPFRYDASTAAQLAEGRFDAAGARQYAQYCMPCHGANGKGFARVFPPLAGNATVLDPSPASLINLLLDGAVTARVETAPTDYHMPGYGWTLDDQELANVLTFIRTSWGNGATPVDAAAVARRRAELGSALTAPAER